jgi:hypothetical protein
VAFTLRISDSELAELDLAAQNQGVSRAQFVTRAALAAARQLSTDCRELSEMVSDIHRVIVQGHSRPSKHVGNGSRINDLPLDRPETPPDGQNRSWGESDVAIAGLVELGWTPAKAKRVIQSLPDGPAAGLIAKALKQGERA